jgi:hypothetical protein
MLRKLLLLVMAVSAIAAAEISLGVDMRYLVGKDEDEREDEREYSGGSADQKQEYVSNSLSIMPVLGIHANDIIEISPFFGYHFYSSKTKSKTSTSTSKSKRSQHGIEPGLGLYFHLINNSDIIDFSLGPKISYGIYFPPNTGKDGVEYDTYVDGIFSAACQINIDLHFSSNFAARLSSSLYRFSINHTKTEVENSDVTEKEVTRTSDFRTVFTPTLGFYFTF